MRRLSNAQQVPIEQFMASFSPRGSVISSTVATPAGGSAAATPRAAVAAVSKPAVAETPSVIIRPAVPPPKRVIPPEPFRLASLNIEKRRRDRLRIIEENEVRVGRRRRQ